MSEPQCAFVRVCVCVFVCVCSSVFGVRVLRLSNEEKSSSTKPESDC